MREKLAEVQREKSRYLAHVCYLHGILNLIEEAMMIYNGQELKVQIVELIKKGEERTRIGRVSGAKPNEDPFQWIAELTYEHWVDAES